MSFKAIIHKEEQPIVIRRLSDGTEFIDCQTMSQGNGSWAPKENDIVLADIDDDDDVCILGRYVQPSDSPEDGTQVGDNKKGIWVTEDGGVVIIHIDTNKVMVNEEGLSMDVESISIKGNGYLKTVQRADKDGAASMETKVTELLQVPTVTATKWERSVTGSNTGSVTIDETVGSGWTSKLTDDGKMIISKLTSMQIGSSGSEPGMLGAKSIQLLKDLLTWAKTHTHPSPAGPTSVATPDPSATIPDTKIDELASKQFKLSE